MVFQPGMVKEYQVAWSQRSNIPDLPRIDTDPNYVIGMDYDPVPPGAYLVRGSLKASLSSAYRPEEVELLETEPLRLVIQPAPNPVYCPGSLWRVEGGPPLPRNCASLSVQQGVNRSAPVTGLNGSLQVWLEAPAEVRAGDLVPLKLYVKNVSDRTLEFWWPSPPYGFAVGTTEGMDLWRWFPLVWGWDRPNLVEFQPGTVKEYQVAWAQRGNTPEPLRRATDPNYVIGIDHDPVPPGAYLVRGRVEVTLSGDLPTEQLETEPLRLVIKPVPDPRYFPHFVVIEGK
jgi:hypothetical protein